MGISHRKRGEVSLIDALNDYFQGSQRSRSTCVEPLKGAGKIRAFLEKRKPVYIKR